MWASFSFGARAAGWDGEVYAGCLLQEDVAHFSLPQEDKAGIAFNSLRKLHQSDLYTNEESSDQGQICGRKRQELKEEVHAVVIEEAQSAQPHRQRSRCVSSREQRRVRQREGQRRFTRTGLPKAAASQAHRAKAGFSL
ncbi:hypothetical protein FQN60_002248, partial [Etheostoma spectabile]